MEADGLDRDDGNFPKCHRHGVSIDTLDQRSHDAAMTQHPTPDVSPDHVAILDAIRALEERLHDPTVRRSPEAVASLLADDFLEVGRSGKAYDKDEVVRSLATERLDRWGPTASDYALKVLGDGVCLLTYRTAIRGDGAAGRQTLRSSVWRLTEGRWQMVFHQGTPTGPGATARHPSPPPDRLDRALTPPSDALSDLYRAYIACLNRRDWDQLGRYVAEDVTHNGRPLGLDGYRAMLVNDVADIPDLRFDIDLLVCDPPRVAARLAFACHPKARFLGLPVDGRRVSFAENVFYEFRASRIASVWSVIDRAAIEAQLKP